MMYRGLLYLFTLVFVLNACSKKKDDKPTEPPVINPPATGQGVQFDTSQQYFEDTTWPKIQKPSGRMI